VEKGGFKAANSSENLVPICKTAWRHIRHDSNFTMATWNLTVYWRYTEARNTTTREPHRTARTLLQIPQLCYSKVCGLHQPSIAATLNLRLIFLHFVQVTYLATAVPECKAEGTEGRQVLQILVH
jgi:hypothetical protein